MSPSGSRSGRHSVDLLARRDDTVAARSHTSTLSEDWFLRSFLQTTLESLSKTKDYILFVCLFWRREGWVGERRSNSPTSHLLTTDLVDVGITLGLCSLYRRTMRDLPDQKLS